MELETFYKELWKIIVAVIASAGGTSAIIISSIKLSSKIIADNLQRKYQLKLDKELENYKSKLDNKLYISKTRFDAEFSMYQELSKNFFQMIQDFDKLIPIDKFSSEYHLFSELNLSHNYDLIKKTREGINANAAFISENFYEKYKTILTYGEQLHSQMLLSNQAYSLQINYETRGKIDREFEEINADLRKYLSTLEVI